MPNAGEHPKKRNFICDLSEWASQRQTHDVEKSSAMKLCNSPLRNFATLSVCGENVHLYFTFRDFLNP